MAQYLEIGDKVMLEQNMKAHVGVSVDLHAFLILTLDGGE